MDRTAICVVRFVDVLGLLGQPLVFLPYDRRALSTVVLPSGCTTSNWINTPVPAECSPAAGTGIGRPVVKVQISVRSGPLPPDPADCATRHGGCAALTETVGLDDSEEAFERMRTGNDLRSVLIP
ncbi:hypothetical protein ACWGLF_38755 [Streptomyces puniciscabiei]